LEQPPHDLNYQRPGLPPSPRSPEPARGVKFFGGLGLGGMISLVGWNYGWNTFTESSSPLMMFLIPGIKIAAAVAFMFVPRWRSFGAGLLLSIGLGLLIFLGVCAAKFEL
jgi:hypothetical protein